MPTQYYTLRLRTAQRGIRALVERDLTAFFWSLDLTKPEAARNALLEFLPFLVEEYGTIAADTAADWYDEFRASEAVAGAFRATALLPEDLRARAQGTVRRAAGALWTDSPTDALTSMLGPAGKYALTGSRATVGGSALTDPAASGWQRVTRNDACKFCRMLAGRGGVYKRASADFASHGDCNCAAIPSWDPNAPEVDVRLYEASERTTRMTEAQRAQHNALIARAIDEYVA